MPAKKTLSGQTVTVTETEGTPGVQNHYFLVNGTAQGVIDFLNENRIPMANILAIELSTTWYVWYHK